MKLDNVKFKNGQAYIERYFNSKKWKGILKEYGQIVNCIACHSNFFATNYTLKKGRGKFCSLKCKNTGIYSPTYKNGKKKTNGYIQILLPTHPFAVKNYIMEHRIIVEKQIGRYLHRWEVVHHINNKKEDNRPENLIAFKNDSIHRHFEAGAGINNNDIVFDGRKLCSRIN